jgi:hypothetical protein
MKPNTSKIIVPRASSKYPAFKEHMGPYNISKEEASVWGELPWQTVKRLPPRSEEEFEAVANQTKIAVSKFGMINQPPFESEIDFFIEEEGCFDRTIKIEVIDYVRFWEVVIPLMSSLAACLQEMPLWRIMFEADQDGNLDEVVVVYPEGVRLDNEKNISFRLMQIAEQRLRRWSHREYHRRQRREELAQAIPRAFKKLHKSTAPVVHVASYDKVSFPLRDDQEEGQTGKSIILMFRDERDYHELSFETDPPDELGTAYFATPSGRILDPLLPDNEIPSCTRMILDFNPPEDSITLCWPKKKMTFR